MFADDLRKASSDQQGTRCAVRVSRYILGANDSAFPAKDA